MQHLVLVVLLFALLFGSCPPVTAEANPPVYFVSFFSPGPNWNDELSATEQPGIEQHHRYMNGLKEAGKMILGGHYLDDAGEMMIFQMKTITDALLAANDDPAVRSGLLLVEVKSWQVNLSSVRITRKRKSAEPLGRKQPFKIKSANQGAPINLQQAPD